VAALTGATVQPRRGPLDLPHRSGDASHGLEQGRRAGAPVGLQARDATLAELLQPLACATGQFGKNHLGDKNEYLPCVHGFDEFVGNLHHLNAEEEPENRNYPADPEFRKAFGPRGVLRCRATEKDDATTDPRWGRVGRRSIVARW
jgi:arylsulfatase